MPAEGALGTPRLGVFGGTFDPFHYGHLVAAQDALETLALDRVLFIPAGRPPHKQRGAQAPAELRFRMSQESVAGDPRFEVLDLELLRDGPSYTVETLQELRRERRGAELFLLVGADQWAGFGRWREPLEIARLARIAVMTREGEHPSEVDPGIAAADGGAAVPEIVEVPVTRIDLSSTGIRERVAEGRSVRYLVPEPVRRIIEVEKLYR